MTFHRVPTCPDGFFLVRGISSQGDGKKLDVCHRGAVGDILFSRRQAAGAISPAGNIRNHPGGERGAVRRTHGSQRRITSYNVCYTKLLRFPDELSGGMVRRVAFARAMVMDPEIIRNNFV